MEIAEHRNFRTWKFRKMEISDMEISEHGNLGTWNLVICQNILKYVEISCYMLKYDEIC